ncbi:MAG: twin-arginine translocase subunit TatC [Chloroflexi bacterium]|nr:twin-arginine translocase subunit TatC [Chloroflexota bacterium]
MTMTTNQSAELTNQSILAHLNDLRIRVTWAAVSVLLGTIASFFFARDILLFLLSPYDGELQVLRPTEGIETYFKVALLAGVILAMPFVLFQLWKFISPGLEKREKRYVYLFIPITMLLFLTGIVFAWLVLVPAAVTFLSTFMPDIFVADWTGQEYIGFILAMLFWLGLSFEMPVVAYFVARIGVVQARALGEQWRFAVVGISVLAAAITPSIDPITMLLTMLPLVILYLISIGTAYVGQRQFDNSMALDK